MEQVSRSKRCTLKLSVTVAAVLLPHIVLGQQRAPSMGSIPVGWYVYPEGKLKNLDETTLRCFNYSRYEWQVTIEGESVKIKNGFEHIGDIGDIPLLPPLLKHEEGMPGRSPNVGLSSATHCRNGWLLAYDAGEWGGGLWFTNEDGSKTKRIVSDNVPAVIPIDGGILVLSGLAHGLTDFGNAFIFSVPDGLSISLQHSVHLDGAPGPYLKESDGSVLLVTTGGLCRITKSGDLQTLVYFPMWTSQQYPNSMAIAPDGTIFIGMRMFVLKLHPTPSGYGKEWLLPNECRNFELRESGCFCTP